MRNQEEAEKLLEESDKVLESVREEERDARGSLASQPQPPQGRTGETDEQRESRRQRREELEEAEEAAEREREQEEIDREADRATEDGNTDQVTDAAYHWEDPEYDDDNITMMGVPAWGENVHHAKYTMPGGFAEGDWWCRCGWHNKARQQFCHQRDDQGSRKRPKYNSQ